MQLLIVRHGQPEASRAGVGPADPGLTDGGRQQAQALTQWLARDGARLPGQVWSSPMRRARETADRIAAGCRLPVEIDDRLAEFDLGAPAYVPMEQVGTAVVAEAMRALDTGRWGEHRFDPESFRLRVRAAFDGIVDRARAADVARAVVVCHGGVINSYLSDVLRRPHGMFFRPRYTSVSRVAIDPDGTPHLLSMNEFPHWATASARPVNGARLAAARH